jgi:hypothetical protein
VSGRCVKGVCADPSKSCPNKCSGAGNCTFFDYSGRIVEYCSSYDSACTAKCSCLPGRFSADCSMSQAQLEQNVEIRETLCTVMQGSSASQDVTLDVVSSRATSVSSMLLDSTQVSETALAACTELLVETVIFFPSLVADDSVSSQCLSALSLALQLGAALPAGLINNVSSALAALATGIEGNLVVGEAPTLLITDNVRVSSQMLDMAGASTTSFSPPLTAVEQLTGKVTPTISIESGSPNQDDLASKAGSLSVSVVKYTGNVHNTSTSTSASVGLSLTTYGVDSGTSARFRRLADDGDGAVLVTLPNSYPINYTAGLVQAENRSITCAMTTEPYQVVLDCSHNRSFPFVCNSSEYDVTIPYSCPSIGLSPVCSTWDGSAFVKNPFCNVVTYTSTATTCRCLSGYESYPSAGLSGTRGSRRLSTKDPALTQFAGVAEAVGDNFVSTISSVTQLTAGDIAKNGMLFGVMTSLVILFFVGFGVVIWVDYKEIDKTKDAMAHKVATVSFSELLTNAIPSDLKPNVKWHDRLWRLLQLQHDVVGLCSGYVAEGDYRTTRWLKVIGLIMNFLFINTVLAVQYFDDNACIAMTTEATCLQSKAMDQVNSMCVWDVTKKVKCSINADATESPLAVMVAASATTILSIPLQVFYVVLMSQVRKYIQSSLTQTSITKRREASEHINTTNLISEMEYKRSARSIIFRAARLVKMQEEIDDVSLPEEVEGLKQYLKREEASQAVKVPLRVRPNEKTESHSRRRTKPTVNTQANATAAVAYQRVMARIKRVSHLISGDTDTKYLTKKIKKLRAESNRISEKMGKMPNDAERNEYLMRKFTLNVLSQYHQNIAGRFFSIFVKGSVDVDIKSSIVSKICIVILPLYMIFEALYVFLFGVSIGPRASRVWLVNCVVTFLHSLLILRPITIWAKSLSLSSMVRIDIHALHDHIQRVSKIVMTRSAGYMKYASCRIQHMNVACRVSRLYPRLPVSRFLMSLNDFDFPEVLEPHTHKTKREMLFEFLFVFLFVGLGFMPESLQDTVMDLVTAAATNGIILGLALFGKMNVAYLAAMLAFIAVGLCLIFATYFSHRKQSRVHPESAGSVDAGLGVQKSDSLEKYIAMEESKRDNRGLNDEGFTLITVHSPKGAYGAAYKADNSEGPMVFREVSFSKHSTDDSNSSMRSQRGRGNKGAKRIMKQQQLSTSDITIYSTREMSNYARARGQDPDLYPDTDDHFDPDLQ